jgi:predicted nucleotidyltransferase
MLDKISALKARYVAEIEKLQVKIEVLDDIAGLFVEEPVQTEAEEVVEGEIEETNELVDL